MGSGLISSLLSFLISLLTFPYSQFSPGLRSKGTSELGGIPDEGGDVFTGGGQENFSYLTLVTYLSVAGISVCRLKGGFRLL